MREKEVTYFQQHPHFSKLPSTLFGISNLSKKLTTLLVRTYYPPSALPFDFIFIIFSLHFCSFILTFFCVVSLRFVSFHFILFFFILFYCGSFSIFFVVHDAMFNIWSLPFCTYPIESLNCLIIPHNIPFFSLIYLNTAWFR